MMRELDPFGRAEKLFSRRYSELAIRAVVIAFLLLFLVHRLGQYRLYLFKPLWVVETLILVAFVVSYAIRLDPLERSRGAREIVVPLVGALLPFALLTSPPSRLVTGDWLALRLVFSWMTASTLLTIWGLWTLRRCFSITIEARELVTGGPYRWIRHPIYLGELLTAGAVAFWRLSALNLAIFGFFVAVQLVRSKWEEAKLTRALPGYAAYASTAAWLWRPATARSPLSPQGVDPGRQGGQTPNRTMER